MAPYRWELTLHDSAERLPRSRGTGQLMEIPSVSLSGQNRSLQPKSTHDIQSTTMPSPNLPAPHSFLSPSLASKSSIALSFVPLV